MDEHNLRSAVHTLRNWMLRKEATGARIDRSILIDQIQRRWEDLSREDVSLIADQIRPHPPGVGTVWRHRYGSICTVLLATQPGDTFPAKVVYQTDIGKVNSLDVDKWHVHMKEQK